MLGVPTWLSVCIWVAAVACAAGEEPAQATKFSASAKGVKVRPNVNGAKAFSEGTGAFNAPTASQCDICRAFVNDLTDALKDPGLPRVQKWRDADMVVGSVLEAFARRHQYNPDAKTITAVKPSSARDAVLDTVVLLMSMDRPAVAHLRTIVLVFQKDPVVSKVAPYFFCQYATAMCLNEHELLNQGESAGTNDAAAQGLGNAYGIGNRRERGGGPPKNVQIVRGGRGEGGRGAGGRRRGWAQHERGGLRRRQVRCKRRRSTRGAARCIGCRIGQLL